MWNAITDGAMPRYWPPRPNKAWDVVLNLPRRWYLRRYYRIAEVTAEGHEELFARFGPRDALVIAPNHSHDSDPHVMMEVARRAGRRFYFMAAWQIFRPHFGLDGFLLQRMGAFSVDRDGGDRRALAEASGLLTSGCTLVVFPEGEVYRLNDRLTPLLDGVAFMAYCARRELARTKAEGRVWLVPAAIRYRYVEDVTPLLAASMDRLEERTLWKSPAGMPLAERIVRFGELLLTIKEKERLGRSYENEGDLPTRIGRFVEALLGQLEQKHLGAAAPGEPVAMRVKALRRRLFQAWTDEAATPEAREALDEVQLALQAYSYPGNYVSQQPSVERMAETIEKFEEDIEGHARPKGRRRARVVFGEPIEVGAGEGKPRAIAAALTDRLEESIAALMRAPA